MSWLPWIIGGFLVGTIPFGLLLGFAKGVDIREQGSGNIGATNAGRVLGRRLGILCFFLDAGKGALPVTLAGLANGAWGEPPRDATGTWLWLAVAAAALLGHMYPPWLRFRGGKGVATGFGGMLAMWPLLTLPALVALVVWVALVAAFRIVSLASMTAACSLPITCVVVVIARGDDLATYLPLIVTTGALAAFVVFKHRSNIARLRAGAEPRIGKTP